MRKAGVAVLGALSAILCLGVLSWRVLTYRPVLIPGPTVEARLTGVQAGSWPSQSGMRLHVFNTGMLRISPILVGKSASTWRPIPAFVLEHPDRGFVIYDCGLGPEVARRQQRALPLNLRLLMELRGRPDRLLDEQMKAAGLSLERVRTVILSHAHFDHIGRFDAFTQAGFVAGPGARRNHREEMSAELSRPLDQIPAPRWQELSFQGTPPFATFAGSHDLFGDRSVVLIPGGGHTREDMLALVMLPRGPILLAGDAIEYREWLDTDDVQRIPDAPERAAAVRNEVRALLRADPSVLLVPGHDVNALSSGRPDVVLHQPEWFSLDAWPST